MAEITQLLTEVRSGNPNASSELFQRVYDELRQLAAARLAQEAPGQTLQPTALVHEVYLRLVAPGEQESWDSVGHFFAAASESMRRILVERARAKKCQKRGGGVQRIDLSFDQVSAVIDDDQLLKLNEALERLEEVEPQKARMVVLRYFGGMSIEEACGILGISRTTAHRHWTYARAWLFRSLSDPQ